MCNTLSSGIIYLQRLLLLHPNTQIVDPNRATVFYSCISEIERVRFVAFDLWIWNCFLCFYSLSPLISGIRQRQQLQSKFQEFFIRLSTEDYDFDNAFGVLCRLCSRSPKVTKSKQKIRRYSYERGTKFLAAVYRPKAGTKKNENPEKACIEVIWKPKTSQSDVYGCVKSIMPESKVFVRSKEKMESKCEVILENLRREDVRITFWGDNAREFNVETVQKRPPPVLAVFTSLRITEFQERSTLTATNHTCMVIDPQIPQRDEYRKEFSKPGDKVKIFAIPFKQPTQQDLKGQRKKTVPDLNTLNLRLYANDTVYCSGKISRFSTHNSWWYNGCPLCRKQLRQKENSSQLSCNKHDVQEPLPCYRVYMTIEDRENEATLIVMEKAAEQLFGNSCQELMNRRQYPTRQTLPKEIEDTIGQHHLFQMEPRSNGELIVKAIFPDPEAPVGVAEQDPTTVTPDRSTSEKKRTVETSKKALFIDEPEKKSKRESRHEKTTSPSPGTEEDQTKKK